MLLSVLSELAHQYLTGRSVRVSRQHQLSAPRQLSTGVPQGSVLGPQQKAVRTALPIIRSRGFFPYRCYVDDTQTLSAQMPDHHPQLSPAKPELLLSRFPFASTLTLKLTPRLLPRLFQVTVDDQWDFLWPCGPGLCLIRHQKRQTTPKPAAGTCAALSTDPSAGRVAAPHSSGPGL